MTTQLDTPSARKAIKHKMGPVGLLNAIPNSRSIAQVIGPPYMKLFSTGKST
jgi:hypothetical protein